MSATPGLERHRRRAAIATRLLEAAPDAAAALDWDALDRGPAWLAVPDTELALEQRRIGATLNTAAIRLWIDRRRLAAARTAVGEAFLRALLADPAAPDVAPHIVVAPDGGSDIAEWLRQAGAAVQAAAISDSPLGQAAAIALCGRAGGALQLAAEAARGLIEHARRIGATLATAAPETQ
ncbi:MAG TPA: hypothetical protein VNV44_03385 [Solirubrobacteraceae bacterium]|jgi:hypothetical protein|nr:hypothetical protein [Solirubrobacteraceae bacterium]